MDGVNELQKKGTKTMANLPGSIKNLNTLLGEQLLDGGGSGGGGSSDFSTAQVTVVNNSQSDVFELIMCVTMTKGDISATTGLVSGTPVGETEVFNVVLYKGNAHIQFVALDEEAPVVITTSGNIRDLGNDKYMVTGDCTITIS